MDFVLIDVFTDRVFGGNQLAVFPNAADLSDLSMAAISRELKLNETVFITGQVSDGYIARIFSPHGELPFAGHPIIGAASVMNWQNLASSPTRNFNLHVPAGSVAIKIKGSPEEPQIMLTSPTLPKRLHQSFPKSDLAALLGLSEGQIVNSHDTAAAYSAGIPFFCIPLVDQHAVRQVSLNKSSWNLLMADALEPHLYVFAQARTDEIHARMFAPGVGIDEDPETGSAAVALGGYLAAQKHHPDGYINYTVHQGDEMGRPSRMQLEIAISGGTLRSVKIGGQCSIFGCGSVLADAIQTLEFENGRSQK